MKDDRIQGILFNGSQTINLGAARPFYMRLLARVFAPPAGPPKNNLTAL